MHAHPELSGEERETAAFIADTLRGMGVEPRTGVGETHGVVADIGSGDGAVALRADFDALPIQEETGVEYASKRGGVMHACGHDAHTAMLLGAAALLKEREGELRRRARLMFQPHEEAWPGGAPAMIAGGALEGVREAFGIHICTNLQFGTIGTRSGPFMAAMNPLKIVIRGRGGHAAMPEEAVDPVVAAGHVVTALQSIVSRNVPVAEPAVVSITQINGGTAHNVIAEHVTLGGTMRTFTEAIRNKIRRRVEQICTQVAEGLGATAEVEIGDGFPVVENDPALTHAAMELAKDLGFDKDARLTLAPQGGGEDFAYYAREVPACIVFLGAANRDKDCIYPHHHPKFNVDEDALAYGAALHAAFAMRD